MTLVSDIIQQAYREGNVLPIGQSPSTDELAEGLKRLNVIVKSVVGNEGGELLASLPVGNNNVLNDAVPSPPTTLPLNVRLVCNLESATTLYLHPRPQDGSRLAVIDASGNFATYNLTLNGNGSNVDGGSTDVLTANDQSIQYFYRADLADWKVVTTLSSSDEFPFPEEFDDMFVTMLAMRLNPRHSHEMAEASAIVLRDSKNAFAARYRQTIPVAADLGVLNLTGQSYGGGNIVSGF